MADPGFTPHYDVAGYVLGTLTPAETATFEAHLAGCAACRSEVAELGPLPSLLRSAASAPAPAVRRRTFDAIAAASRPSAGAGGPDAGPVAGGPARGAGSGPGAAGPLAGPGSGFVGPSGVAGPAFGSGPGAGTGGPSGVVPFGPGPVGRGASPGRGAGPGGGPVATPPARPGAPSVGGGLSVGGGPAPWDAATPQSGLPAGSQAGPPAGLPSNVTPLRPRRPRAVRWLAATAAALLVVAAVGIGAVMLNRDSGGTVIALAAADVGSGSGTAVVSQVDGGRRIELTVSGLPANPPGTYYECWFVGPGDTEQQPNRVSAGTFTVGADGTATVTMVSAADATLFPKMGVTLEPDDGNPARTGPKYLVSS